MVKTFKVVDYDEAVSHATKHSLNTNKKVYLNKNVQSEYTVDAYGVKIVGETNIAIFHRGQVVEK